MRFKISMFFMSSYGLFVSLLQYSHVVIVEYFFMVRLYSIREQFVCFGSST